MALQAAFADRYEVVETIHRHLGEGQMAFDLGDGAMIRTTLALVRPDVVPLPGLSATWTSARRSRKSAASSTWRGRKRSRGMRGSRGAGRVLFHRPGV